MADKLTKEALAEQRKRLKMRLWRERSAPVSPGSPLTWLPECDYSGRAILNPDDCVMHEWLIKRSDLPVEKQHLIMHEYNCVLVRYDCHERFGQTREFKLRCAKAQYKRYSYEEIREWAQSLGLKQHIEIPLESEVA